MRKSLNVVISVINDLSTDQRVAKMCNTLHQMGHNITLVGRQLPDSLGVNNRPYKVVRFKLPFNKGILFYGAYQLRLSLFLFTNKFDVYHANDLDTLLPNTLLSIFRTKTLVYDAHEYFTGVPELSKNPIKKGIWKLIERFCFSNLKNFIAANKGIAELYEQEYQLRPLIVRNIPNNHKLANPNNFSPEVMFKNNFPFIILQGAGINVNRGLEELIEAISLVPHLNLLIIGDGDVVYKIHELSSQFNVKERVVHLPKMPYDKLIEFTRNAYIGVTLDKPDNLNYMNSLPNKLFDYISAEIPILTSNIKQIAEIVIEREIGFVAQNHEPKHLAECLTLMLENKDRYETWKMNLKIISSEYSWEQEIIPVIKMYEQFA